jgi:hypothetical protein
MLSLNWIKLRDIDAWCKFHTVRLDAVTTGGVYIIWHSGNPGRVVYVGQGDVKSRLTAHRLRSDICDYAKHGDLHVTWAAVPAAQRDGVERHLADKWHPLIGDAHPDVQPIAVNSPF